MRLRLILVAFLTPGTILLLVLVGLPGRTAIALQSQQDLYIPTKLDLFERAKELKSVGRTEAHMGTLVTFPPFESFEQMQDYADAVVVATLEDFRYRPSESRMSIETVYRFRIDDLVSGSTKIKSPDLGTQGLTKPPPMRGVPGVPGFQAPSSNEVLVVASGGILRIDGVLFIEQPTYERFKRGRQYILFLGHFVPHKPRGYYGDERFSLMSPLSGPYGCIEVEDHVSGQLRSLSSRLRATLEERFFSNKEVLLEHLRDRGR